MQINKEKKRMEEESESKEAKLRVQLASVTSEFVRFLIFLLLNSRLDVRRSKYDRNGPI